MAVLFMDGCEHYDTTSGIYLKWTNQAFAQSTASGRHGRGISLTQGGAYVAKTLTHQNGWVVGWAMNILVSGSGGVGGSGLYGGTNVSSGLITVEILSDWTLAIYAGNNFAVGSSPFSLHPNTWYYFEFKYTLGTGGMGGANVTIALATLKVNGNIVATCSNIDSGIPLNSLLVQSATVDYHSFACPNVIGTTTLDDVVIADLTGNGVVNDFFGDVTVGAIFPNGDSTIQWTPNPAGSSFSLVNSQFAEGSAGYIASNTPNQHDVFTWQPLPADTGAIVALHYGVFAKKDGEGTRSIQTTIGGASIPTTPAAGSSAPFSGYPPPIWYPGDTYCYFFFAMDSQPGSLTPWTAAAVNGTSFGINLNS